jgi:hypothetical protein
MGKLPYMRTPCNDCPLTKECINGWLGEKRAKEIANAGSFVCHKTTGSQEDRRQCAGHMIAKGMDNDFFRLAKQFDKELDLNGQDRVFDSMQDFINHHKFENNGS